MITTKATEVKKLVDNFFRDNNFLWDVISAICSDGASVMLGRNSSLVALVKADAPHVTVTHCLLHRYVLATKTFPLKLAKVLKIVVECGNYARNSAMKYCMFRKLCNEMGSEFEALLYYPNVRWLSWRKTLNRVFVLRLELAVLLQTPSCRLF